MSKRQKNRERNLMKQIKDIKKLMVRASNGIIRLRRGGKMSTQEKILVQDLIKILQKSYYAHLIRSYKILFQNLEKILSDTYSRSYS